MTTALSLDRLDDTARRLLFTDARTANAFSDQPVTDAELTRENQRTVWDVSVEVAGGDDYELWIDASSGKVVRSERD